MIVEILIAQGQAIDPLRDQRMSAVLDTVGVAVIGEATGHPLQQTYPLINLPQQQSTTVGSDPAAVKTTHHIAATQCVKFQLIRGTLCWHRPSLLFARKVLFALTLCNKERPISILSVRFSG
jgi:hypothetical protein